MDQELAPLIFWFLRSESLKQSIFRGGSAIRDHLNGGWHLQQPAILVKSSTRWSYKYEGLENTLDKFLDAFLGSRKLSGLKGWLSVNGACCPRDLVLIISVTKSNSPWIATICHSKYLPPIWGETPFALRNNPNSPKSPKSWFPAPSLSDPPAGQPHGCQGFLLILLVRAAETSEKLGISILSRDEPWRAVTFCSMCHGQSMGINGVWSSYHY